MDTIRVGDKVQFGRRAGEHTEGVVTKINRRTVSIRQTEARGTHPVGTVWRVGRSLVWAAGQACPIQAPVAEPVPSTESEIMQELLSCYCGLSPENLWCDGEASASYAHAKERKLNARIRVLEKALGRHVSESDVYRWADANRH